MDHSCSILFYTSGYHVFDWSCLVWTCCNVITNTSETSQAVLSVFSVWWISWTTLLEKNSIDQPAGHEQDQYMLCFGAGFVAFSSRENKPIILNEQFIVVVKNIVV